MTAANFPEDDKEAKGKIQKTVKSGLHKQQTPYAPDTEGKRGINMLLLEQMIVLFILMGIGFFCYKKGVITQEVSRRLSTIVVNIANAALVLAGGMGDEKISGQDLRLTLLIVVFMYAALLALAVFLPGLLRVEGRSRGTYRAMTVFSNIGFMGFPVINALYGSGALLYATFFMIPYNILIYTYGISAVAGKGSEKNDGKGKSSLSQIFNVGFVACIVTLVIYFTNWQAPVFVKNTLTHLSNLTSPLSMMVIGASLATIDLRKLFTDVRLIIFSVLKLVVIPVLGLLVIRQFVDSEVMLGVCLVMLATPVGSMTAMLAQQYEGDYEMASKGVALTTILSVLTMPLVSGIML